MQLLQERIAWSAVDMYAMAAVISRLQSILAAEGGSNGTATATATATAMGTVTAVPSSCGHELIVGKGFCRRAASAVRGATEGVVEERRRGRARGRRQRDQPGLNRQSLIHPIPPRTPPKRPRRFR